jgi:c-di-GMP-binding flagellar brake protein YcgR
VSDTLVKPFNLETLVEKVHLALTRSPVERTYPRLALARVGQQIALYTEDGVCATRVLNCLQDTILVTGAPRVETPAEMSVGQRVRVHIQGQDALYSFQSRITRQHFYPIPCWELAKPRVIRRQQRRKHTRYPLRLEVSVRPLSAPEPEEENRPSVQQAFQSESADGRTEYTADVSLGGCAITTERPLKIGENVRLVFFSGKEETYAGQGRIVRIQPVSPPSRAVDFFRLGVRFTELNTATRRFLRDRLQSGDFFSRIPE